MCENKPQIKSLKSGTTKPDILNFNIKKRNFLLSISLTVQFLGKGKQSKLNGDSLYWKSSKSKSPKYGSTNVKTDGLMGYDIYRYMYCLISEYFNIISSKGTYIQHARTPANEME